MGKRIISQRRGRGTTTYRAMGFRFAGKLSYGIYGKDKVMRGKVIDLVHSKGHSAPLMAVKYSDGREALLPAYIGCYIGKDFVMDLREEVDSVSEGNCYLLKNIPEGTEVYNVELIPGDGGKLARGGGSSVKVVSHIGDMVKILLPSKREKLVKGTCRAIVGIVGGGGRTDKPFVKAGTKYYEMKKKNKLYPRTSGGKMSAVDHPFGNTRSLRKGQPTVAPKNAPPGRKVGMIRPKKTGRGK